MQRTPREMQKCPFEAVSAKFGAPVSAIAMLNSLPWLDVAFLSDVTCEKPIGSEKAKSICCMLALEFKPLGLAGTEIFLQGIHLRGLGGFGV